MGLGKPDPQDAPLFDELRDAVNRMLRGNVPRLELLGTLADGKQYRAVIYTVNEIVPVRIDFKRVIPKGA